MAVRDLGAKPLALGRPPAQPGHLGAGAGLVDEHEMLRVEVGLALEPGLTRGVDVGSPLLGRVSAFF